MFRLSRSKPPTQERDEEGQPSKRSRRKSGQLEPPQVVVRDVEQFAFMFFNGEKNFGENLTILRYRLSRGITFQHNLDKYKTILKLTLSSLYAYKKPTKIVKMSGNVCEECQHCSLLMHPY